MEIEQALANPRAHRTASSGAILGATARPGYIRAKRAIDLFFALASLIFLAPLLLLIAAAIRFDSRGPALFRQQRAGARSVRRGKWIAFEPCAFEVVKFRTMTTDSDDVVHKRHVEAFVNGTLNGDRGFKLNGDARVTHVGRLLRRSSLDELPQLINVLRGQMSLVGPRPVPLYEADLYGQVERERLAATPGVTGLWQVSGRCDVSFEDMIKLDLEYVARRSLLFDFWIILRTVPAVFAGRGAG